MDDAETDAVEKLKAFVAHLESRPGALAFGSGKTLRPAVLATLLSRLSAAEAKVGRLEETISAIGRHARSDGDRTFDDCIRDLALIDDRCRAALKDPTS